MEEENNIPDELELEQTEVEEEEEEVETLDLSVIAFGGRNLEEWQNYLTIKMPVQPASSLTISQTIADFNDKYQDAFNCYIQLTVTCSALKRELEVVMNTARQEARASLAKQGHKRIASTSVDSLASTYSRVKRHNLILVNNEIVKSFFESHKNKLEKSMWLVNGLLYTTNQSDRMYNKASNIGGL